MVIENTEIKEMLDKHRNPFLERNIEAVDLSEDLYDFEEWETDNIDTAIAIREAEWLKEEFYEADSAEDNMILGSYGLALKDAKRIKKKTKGFTKFFFIEESEDGLPAGILVPYSKDEIKNAIYLLRDYYDLCDLVKSLKELRDKAVKSYSRSKRKNA